MAPRRGDEQPACKRLQIVVDGRRWTARTRLGSGGARPAVVLVHGFGVSSAYFERLAARLGRDFDVYAPDLPGHGASAAPERDFDIAWYAERLLAWLRSIPLRRVLLIAHSMGSQVAAELTARDPSVVERLVLIGPTLDTKAQSALRIAARLLAGGFEEKPSMLSMVVRDYLHMAPRLWREFRAMRAHHIEAPLARVGVPVLLIRGDNDRVAPHAWLEKLQRVTRDARIATVPNAGHAPQFSDVESLLSVLLPFLNGATSGLGTRREAGD
jgi:2-hydroxy-6-oxonona-2,4-dienedioate hydrolase